MGSHSGWLVAGTLYVLGVAQAGFLLLEWDEKGWLRSWRHWVVLLGWPIVVPISLILAGWQRHMGEASDGQ